MMKIPLQLNLLTFLAVVSVAQGNPDQAKEEPTSERSGGRIIIEAPQDIPEPPVFYSADVDNQVTIDPSKANYAVTANVKILQGNATTFSFHTRGTAEVLGVEGKTVEAWAVRWDSEKKRYIEITVKPPGDPKEPVTNHTFSIRMSDKDLSLPSAQTITNLADGSESIAGFNEVVSIRYTNGVIGKVSTMKGFLPLTEAEENTTRLQTATGGKLVVQLNRSGTSPAPVELSRFDLEGELSPDGKSMTFHLKTTATVSKAGASVAILSGNAAFQNIPDKAPYQLRVKANPKGPVSYEMTFDKEGTYPIELDFVARVKTEGGWKKLDFAVASGAVAPIRVSGFSGEVEFLENAAVVPEKNARSKDTFDGFIPATGQCMLAWKESRKIGEGKLFFSTSAQIETTVSAGLLRQRHDIEYRVLQGELDELKLDLIGPGEVLDIQGTNVVGWSLDNANDQKVLNIRLGQAITETGTLSIRTQLPMDAFPVRVKGIRITPQDSVRHSGYIRLSNESSVRLEPAEISGLTQLAPEQFPGQALEARQVFVFRFPAAEYDFEVLADRIQPEVNVSELVLYQLSETDRTIAADVEFDIREAPIREWDLLVPEDYSVVSVSGASVADYIAATETENGVRNLKIIFSSDIIGRQLVSLNLENSVPAAAGDWVLPALQYPDAASVRGDIGIVGAPGFRISASETHLLVEKPLSYFPKQVANLQQAFRIREPGWSATMQVELLEKSVQTDVFHLYSLSDGTAYGSVLINYFVTGAPVSELQITTPADLGNVAVEGKDVRSFRRDGDGLIVTLHQPVIGPYTLLVTFEEKLDSETGTLQPGRVAPNDVQGERGYLQIVSPMQVQTDVKQISEDLLKLDALELPAEFRLLSAAPSLGAWQYTDRPFELSVQITWFEPGTMVSQVVEFSEVTSRISSEGELVSDLVYYVKSRGHRVLKLQLPDSVRLWAVTVGGESVTARQSGDTTLIPLPGGTDPNVPVEVNLRIGRPAVEGTRPVAALPLVEAPVLKTEWTITGDEQHVVIPTGGTVEPPVPVLPASGLRWLSLHGIGQLAFILGLAAIGIWMSRKPSFLGFLGLCFLLAALVGALGATLNAYHSAGRPQPLQLSLPLVMSGELVELHLRTLALWKANLSWLGIILIVAGVVVAIGSFLRSPKGGVFLWRAGGGLLIALGILTQRNGAPWFFLFLAAILFVGLLLPRLRFWWKEGKRRRSLKRENKKDLDADSSPSEGTATASILIGALLIFGSGTVAKAQGVVPEGFAAADSIKQEWSITHENGRLTGKGTVLVSGKPGDSFLLLRAPATLTEFQGEGLRLTRQNLAEHGLSYIITIPEKEEKAVEVVNPFDLVTPATEKTAIEATFQFQVEIVDLKAGFLLPTGPAAVQEIRATYDRPDWIFSSEAAVQVKTIQDEKASSAILLLAPQAKTTIQLHPKARDVASEETHFFTEVSNLYIPNPGVIDGRHKIHIRPAQGQVSSLTIQIPEGITVSEVTGPIGAWQFDADSRNLELSIEPAQAESFDIIVETQRGLDPLPTDAALEPLRVMNAAGEVGLLAIAFSGDAQPEKAESETMSPVNLGDFSAELLPNDKTVLHRVYRYGSEGGSLALRVAPVAPEVRVASKQILSLGDERVVLAVNFLADVTRAGLFKLSFPLPDGLEVESLTGDALHHWAELSEGESRQIVLHLNGKTIGSQSFSLTLTGSSPEEISEWTIPHFQLNEANRQTGELVVKPTTGIRLRTVDRQNVSEIDPRSLGDGTQGSLAFRLLQQDWNLVLGIEKLDPWVTGQVLHEVFLREGQTRTSLFGNFKIQNASVRSLRVKLPITGEEEVKTLRASGNAVSDLVRTAPDSDVWEIQFKRRVVGDVDVRIEYERRGERENQTESLSPAEFPEARQLAYYFGIRAGGRLEVRPEELTRGWQNADWNTVPQKLREAGNRNAPVVTLRTVNPERPLVVEAKSHSLAEALKLRVANGKLTTVLSPFGDQLTSVDLTMEVIQRSSLSIGLPANGELFSIFVNGESVHSVRQGDTWQFYILPGANDRTANVKFFYSVPGEKLSHVDLTSPQLDVPLENIEWSVVAPKGFELTDDGGNLKLKQQQNWSRFDKSSYLNKASGQRREQAQKAAELLEQANDLLQKGEQSKARWAFNSVANQYGLDAASNEDARVQLENLQTQQAIVGLNTRRQRVYIDNGGEEQVNQPNQQIQAGITENRILQEGDLNYRPQELSQLLQGNTDEDNAALQRIAGRLVQHQRTTVPAPQAVTITLPEEGTVYTFTRTIQVEENAPLELDLSFSKSYRMSLGRTVLLALLLFALFAGFAKTARWRTA